MLRDARMANTRHDVRISWPNQQTADEVRQDFGERIAQRETAKQHIEAFVRRQAKHHEVQNFGNVAKLYADASKAEAYDVRMQRALRELQEWLLAGRFHRDGVHRVWAIHEMEERRCNVLGEELPGFQITDEILQQFRGNPNLDYPDNLAPWVPHMWASTGMHPIGWTQVRPLD
jgi:hypothetical protein